MFPKTHRLPAYLVFLLALLAILALLAGACGRGHGPATPERVQPPETLDEAGLDALLMNPGPGPLVVNFWATWCAACRGEMGILHDIARERPGARFALVSVDFPGTRESRLLPYLAREKVTLPVYHLESDQALSILDRKISNFVGAIPVTWVVGPGGRPAGHLNGRVIRAELLTLIDGASGP